MNYFKRKSIVEHLIFLQLRQMSNDDKSLVKKYELQDKFQKLGFNTKHLPEPTLFEISGVQTKCYQLKDIVFGLDPKVQTKIIIYKKQKKMKQIILTSIQRMLATYIFAYEFGQIPYPQKIENTKIATYVLIAVLATITIELVSYGVYQIHQENKIKSKQKNQ